MNNHATNNQNIENLTQKIKIALDKHTIVNTQINLDSEAARLNIAEYLAQLLDTHTS